jgi:hypothetical protein
VVREGVGLKENREERGKMRIARKLRESDDPFVKSLKAFIYKYYTLYFDSQVIKNGFVACVGPNKGDRRRGSAGVVMGGPSVGRSSGSFGLKKGIERKAYMRGATCNIILEYTMKGPSHGSLG